MNCLLQGFISEHNISFAHALYGCKRDLPDSKIVEKVAMKSYKMSHVIQDRTAFYEKLALNDICKKEIFSILIEVSTDIFVIQILRFVI